MGMRPLLAAACLLLAVGGGDTAGAPAVPHDATAAPGAAASGSASASFSRTVPATPSDLVTWAMRSLDARGQLYPDARTAWQGAFAVHADRDAEEARAARARAQLSALVGGGAFGGGDAPGGGGAGRATHAAGERAAARGMRRARMQGIASALGGAAAAVASPAMRLREARRAAQARGAARPADPAAATAAAAAAASQAVHADAARDFAEGLFLELAAAVAADTGGGSGGGGVGEEGSAALLEVAGGGDPGMRLQAMLLEAETRGGELLAAGVHSREIFACVVDQIMNMAPEVILQIIINGVREPMVNLLSTVLAQMTPDLLVPNSGVLPTSASLTGAMGMPAPPMPPCVCAANDGSAYDPSAGISAAFVEMDGKTEATLAEAAAALALTACTSAACEDATRLLAQMQAHLDAAGTAGAAARAAAAATQRAPLGLLVEVSGTVGRLVEVAPWCPCLAADQGFAFAPLPREHGVFAGEPPPLAGAPRFASAGAAAGAAAALAASSRVVMGAAAAADAQQAAAADAFAAAAAWTQAGAGKPAPGPIGLITMRVTQAATDGLAAQGLPRLHAGVAEALKARLARAAPAAAHRAIVERTVPALVAALTPALVARTAAAAAQPLVLGVAARMTADLTPALAVPLSLALVRALTHNPADDFFCAYCAAGGVPPALNATLDLRAVPLEVQRGEQRVGAYCAACARASARDRLQDAQVAGLARRHAGVAVAAALRDMPAVVDAALHAVQAAVESAAAK